MRTAIAFAIGVAFGMPLAAAVRVAFAEDATATDAVLEVTERQDLQISLLDAVARAYEPMPTGWHGDVLDALEEIRDEVHGGMEDLQRDVRDVRAETRAVKTSAAQAVTALRGCRACR